MREKMIESRLVKKVQSRGGLCWKFTSPGTDGVPDRIVLMPGGKIAFVEVKAPGEKMRALQIRRKQQLERVGFSVYCLDSLEQIRPILDEVGGEHREVHSARLSAICDSVFDGASCGSTSSGYGVGEDCHNIDSNQRVVV